MLSPLSVGLTCLNKSEDTHLIQYQFTALRQYQIRLLLNLLGFPVIMVGFIFSRCNLYIDIMISIYMMLFSSNWRVEKSEH